MCYAYRARKTTKGSTVTKTALQIFFHATPRSVRYFSSGAVLAVSMSRSQAEAEGLTLLKSDNKAGYYGVHLTKPGCPKPYQARVTRGGKQVHLGHFVTAEEAALHVARSPEGRAAAKKAAASEEGNAPVMPPGATLKEEGAVPPMPPGAFVKEEGVVPPMPPDATVKREHAVVVKEEEERSDGRGKRRRSK